MYFVENERVRPNDSDLGRFAGAKFQPRKNIQTVTTHRAAVAETCPIFRSGGNWFKRFDTVNKCDKSRIKARPQYPARLGPEGSVIGGMFREILVSGFPPLKNKRKSD